MLPLDSLIGTRFPDFTYQDSAGVPMKIDFADSGLTVVDFWFKACPPCIQELNKFEDILEGKKGIRLVSVSVNSFNEWKGAMHDSSSRFRFFRSSVPHWTHLVLRSKEDQRLRNALPYDNMKGMMDSLGVDFFPAYFVVNKDGVIVERPFSALEYISKH